MIEALLKGFAISLLLVFSVGPLIFTIIKQSITNGKPGGFSYVAGVWVSDIIWALLANVFSSFVEQLLHFEKAIGIIGGIFLILMGSYYIFLKKIKIDESGSMVKSSSYFRLFTSGFLFNTLNPGVIIFWLTWSTLCATGYTPFQRIIIFSTCILINIGADTLKVVLSHSLSDKLTVKNISLISKISGLLLFIFGIALLFGFHVTTSH
jgi:threonine/homoserine/homoserine lactone efflux protein